MSWLDDVKSKWRQSEENKKRAEKELKEQQKQVQRSVEFLENQYELAFNQAFKDGAPILENLLSDIQKELNLKWRRINWVERTLDNPSDGGFGHYNVYLAPRQVYPKHQEHKQQRLGYVFDRSINAYCWEISGLGKYQSVSIILTIEDRTLKPFFLLSYGGSEPYARASLDKVKLQNLLKEILLKM